MDANVANFNLRAIPEGFGSEGGYSGHLEGRPTFDFDRVLDENVRRYGGDKKQLRTDVEHVLDTAVYLAANYLTNIQLGDYLLLRPFLGGRFPDRRAKFNPSTNKVFLRALCKKELKIDFSHWTFHNNTDGRTMKVTSANSYGADNDTEVMLGRDLEINGDWLLLLVNASLDPEDGVTYACEKADGEVLTGEAEVIYSSLHRITCRWPAALDASTVGCKVVFTVHGRCGEDDAVQQHVSTKQLTIVEDGAPAPTPPVEPPVATSYESEGMEGEPITLNGGSVKVNGTNLAGATKIAFRYAEDGEPFYEAYTTEATATTAECAQLGYAGTVTGENGFLSVITPSGESNKLACTFTA